jgi:HEAT repeat protein
VLEAAVRAAGAVRHKPLVPRLVELVDYPAPFVRREAALALAAMEASGAVPRLAKALSEDDDATVRMACAKALGDLGGAGGLGALTKAADSDKDSNVKFVAAESLRRLGFKKSP